MNERIKEIENELGQNPIIQNQNPIRSVLLYFAFGFLWILFSDGILGWMVKNPAAYQSIQTYKGWMYVAITSIGLYFVIQLDYRKVMQLSRDVSERNQQLLTFNEELIAMEEELHQKLKKLYETTDELMEQKKYVYEIYNSSNAMILVWNLKGEVLDVNEQFSSVLGYELETIYGRKWIDFLIPSSDMAIVKDMIERLKTNYRVSNVENKVICANGSEIDVLWNDAVIQNPMTGEANIVSFGIDVTKQRQSERDMQRLAYVDTLTGLQNRVVYEARLDALVDQGTPFTIYYIDIDDFKQLNELHGHQSGNQFLRQYAGALSVEFPEMEIFRWCEDEFLLIEVKTSNMASHDTADKIRRMTQREWDIDTVSYIPNISIGTTQFPKDGANAQTLLMTVDMALYKAKSLGKGLTVNYDSALLTEVESWANMENIIVNALKHEAFDLFCQPIYAMQAKQMAGVEILLRWQDNPLAISTQDLINMAERSGHILEIDEWVVENVFKFISQTSQELIPYIFSINLSVQTFKSERLLPFLNRMMETYEIDPTQIEFEITEYSFIDDFGSAKEAVKRLKALGFRIALDDFGTRFSSLNYLVQMPFDSLKVDKSYVDGLSEDTNHAVVVEHIVKLASAMGLKTVAEGIEVSSQYQRLSDMGCDLGQGYLMAKPFPVKHLLDMTINTELRTFRG